MSSDRLEILKQAPLDSWVALSEDESRIDAITDSGATSCSFHASIGRAIGLEIEKGRRTETLGVAGPSQQYLHNIVLDIPGGAVTLWRDFPMTFQ